MARRSRRLDHGLAQSGAQQHGGIDSPPSQPPYSYDRLAGAWEAIGVADDSAMEEKFVLEGGRKQLADGSWCSTCSGVSVPGDADKFVIVDVQLVRGGPAITFTQRYPDGVETRWSALLSVDHSEMLNGSWEGFEGSFSCRRVVTKSDKAAKARRITRPAEHALTEVTFGGQTLRAMDGSSLVAAGGAGYEMGFDCDVCSAEFGPAGDWKVFHGGRGNGCDLCEQCANKQRQRNIEVEKNVDANAEIVATGRPCSPPHQIVFRIQFAAGRYHERLWTPAYCPWLQPM